MTPLMSERARHLMREFAKTLFPLPHNPGYSPDGPTPYPPSRLLPAPTNPAPTDALPEPAASLAIVHDGIADATRKFYLEAERKAAALPEAPDGWRWILVHEPLSWNKTGELSADNMLSYSIEGRFELAPILPDLDESDWETADDHGNFDV